MTKKFRAQESTNFLSRLTNKIILYQTLKLGNFTDSKAELGHVRKTAFSKVHYSLILSVQPFVQKGSDSICSPVPPGHFYVKAKCTFIGLFGDQVIQVKISTISGEL